jgi:1,2-diacylglycerol 3-alpha-glucosyltransferase
MNLAEGLAQTGQAVLVVAPSETGRAYHKCQQTMTLQTVPALSLGYNVNITALTDGLVSRALREFNPDVVHLQDHYFLSRSVLRTARQHHVAVVGTNHFLPENLTDNLPLPQRLRELTQPWLWRTMLEIYNQLDGVTAPTQTAVSLLNQQGLRVQARAISCGVDQTRFRPRPTLDRSLMRRKYGLAIDEALLLYVGRVDREKGLDLIVRALAQLNRTDAQLAISGQGSYLKDLKQLCQALGLRERVVFTGFVSDEDLPLLFNSADAFVMPSHAELQSIATLEAMSSGLPVLAANAYALPELVTPGVNGYLFSVNEVDSAAHNLVVLLDNRLRWAEMGQASRLKALPHARYHTIQAYAGWYQEVLSAMKGIVPLAKLNSHPVQAAVSPRSDRISEAGPTPLRPNINHGPRAYH